MRRRAERNAKAAASQAAKAQGCVCDLEIEVVGWHASVPEVVVKHDDWCPLLRVMNERGPDRAPQIVMDLDRRGGWASEPGNGR